MAAINQRIPNFLGGVSQQPDSIKFPGQLRVCDNAVPDVTFGLTKRPPGELVSKLTWNNSGTATPPTDNGYWYEILRDGDEKYLVQITPGAAANSIKIWDLADGTEKTVGLRTGTSNYNYLNGATKPYSLQTIQDLTVIANPNVDVKTSSTVPNNGITGNYCFVNLDTIAYNTEYTIYMGDTMPNQGHRFRVTEAEARWNAHDGKTSKNEPGSANTLNSTQEYHTYNGQAAFGDTSAMPLGQRTANGRVLINSNTYISKQEHDNNSEGDFLGYKTTYSTKYYSTVVLKNGGNYENNPVNNHTEHPNGVIATVSIGGSASWTWKVKAIASRRFHTYEHQTGCVCYRTPENAEDGTLNVALVLEKLKDKIVSNSNGETVAGATIAGLGTGITCEVIGNGLFIKHANAHKVNFLGGVSNEGMSVIGRTVTDVGQLPAICKHGFTVEVANSENIDSDSYYLRFEADSGTHGPGKWVECACPDDLKTDELQKLGFDVDTMPHGLKNNRDGTFTFGKLDLQSNLDIMGGDSYYWKNRDIGDMISNPIPSIYNQKSGTDHDGTRSISKIFFHRNRLGLVANEQVVLSRPHDYFNLFNVSAITTSDDNPIDLNISDTKPAYIHHVLPSQTGVMMFSDNGQFLLYTENDIFSPKTARLKKVSGYECDASIDPVDMGTSIMWASTVGAYTRTFEATIPDANAPPKIIEQTRVVPEFIPNSITLASNSSSLGLVTYGKKGQPELYHYKYFDSGDRRDQSAWYSWYLAGNLQHGFFTAGNYYTVTKQNNEFILSRYEYVTASDSNRTYTLGTGVPGTTTTTARWFEACLDNMAVKANSNFTWDDATKTSSVTLDYTPTAADYNTGKIKAVVLSGNDAGLVVVAQPASSDTETILSSGTTAKFKDVNLTDSNDTPKIAVGRNYDTIIEFPTYYSAFEPGKYDLNGDLRISGINFEMGVSGPMEFWLNSIYGDWTDTTGDGVANKQTKDIADYIQYEPGMLIGTGQFSKPPAVLNKSVRVPIQRKNDKYTLQLVISDPFSTSLISGSWDGRYNTKRHVRK